MSLSIGAMHDRTGIDYELAVKLVASGWFYAVLAEKPETDTA